MQYYIARTMPDAYQKAFAAAGPYAAMSDVTTIAYQRERGLTPHYPSQTTGVVIDRGAHIDVENTSGDIIARITLQLEGLA